MSWLSDPSGATKAKAKSSTGCPSRPTSSCASRAVITPATPWSSMAQTYKLSLLPSGVVREGKLSVIGNGVVIDPQALIDEIAQLKKQGIVVTPATLRIAENATLILPLHRELEALREAENAATRIGTTKRGIGPAYEDKVGRRAIRFMDLADLPALRGKIDRLLAHHNALRRGHNLPRSR